MRRHEFGLMIDCDANGCTERHRDHGRIIDSAPQADRLFVRCGDGRYEINNHACTLVKRTVDESPWSPVSPVPVEATREQQ